MKRVRPKVELEKGSRRLAMSTENQENQEKSMSAANSEPQYAAFLAIDWADQKHAWSLQDAHSAQPERGEVEHTPEAIEAWVAQMIQRFAGRPLAVAVEQTRGALVFLLSKYELLHIFPVPPAMSANVRKAFYSSGAKDDPKDADLLLEIVQKHRGKLRRLAPDTEETRRIQNLVEERRKLVDEKTAQSNRLEAQLKIYFPQIPRWFKDVDSPLVCALLERWPTLEELQKARPAALQSFFRKHGCRREEQIEDRVKAIGEAMPALKDRAVVETKVAVVKVLLQLIAVLRKGIRDFDRQIAEAAEVHPDFFIFDSLPGAGAAMAPRLLAVFGSQRERHANAGEVQTRSGIAPVRESSGKSSWVHFRFACPKFIRQSFHEFADCSIRQSSWARAYYDQQRSRGKKHHAAVRALAFKWIRIIYRCWKERVAYQEAIYLTALAKHNSPLATTKVGAVAL
jgi:transposase